MPFFKSFADSERRVGDRHDLIVVPVHNERRHVDDLQVVGEIRLGEGLDAVVLRLGAAHHRLAPPIVDDRLGHLGAGPVEAVERPAREIAVELRAVGGELSPKAIEHLDRQAAGVGGRLHQDRRHGTDENQLGDAALALAVAGDVVRRLAAPRGMAEMDCVAQVEMLDHGCDVCGVVVHVVAVAHLGRSAVLAPVVGDHAIALAKEIVWPAPSAS